MRRQTILISMLAMMVSLSAFAAYADDPVKNWQEIGQHLRLKENLDRPKDGWCLDVVGSGPNIRFDMPLIGHNCKPGLFADEAVLMRGDGSLFFPAYGGCVTAMGLNEHILPMTALMLKKCGQEIPFLRAANFQSFELTETDQIRLKGTTLCMTMGAQSEITFDATHRWRTLFMQDCTKAEPPLSQWVFVKPKIM